MASYYTQYSFAVEDLSSQEEAWLSKRIDDENEREYYCTLPSCTFLTEQGDESKTLWIHDPIGGSDLEVLAELLQDFLQTFRPSEYIAFSWADTCSMPRTDSFGGGAVFITAENIVWVDTHDWIAKQIEMKGAI